MDGYEYERRCAEYLKSCGFKNVTVTKKSGDQGIDITAVKSNIKYGIQCKYYQGSIGNSAIQEAYSGAAFYDCNVAVVMTNATFTKAAIELSKKLGVRLWSGHKDYGGLSSIPELKFNDMVDLENAWKKRLDDSEKELGHRIESLQALLTVERNRNQTLTKQLDETNSRLMLANKSFSDQLTQNEHLTTIKNRLMIATFLLGLWLLVIIVIFFNT